MPSTSLFKPDNNLQASFPVTMSLCKVHERGVCFVPAILLQYFSVLNLCFVEQVEDVCMGPKELLSTSDSVRPSLLIDASAIDPQTCCYLAKRVADCKLSFNSNKIGTVQESPLLLDAPVSGDVVRAQVATLTFMD
jgi:hypothetical protein